MSHQHSSARDDSERTERIDVSTLVILLVSLLLMGLITAIFVRSLQLNTHFEEHSSPAASRLEPSAASPTIAQHAPEAVMVEESSSPPTDDIPAALPSSEKTNSIPSSSLQSKAVTLPPVGKTPVDSQQKSASPFVEQFDRQTYDALAQLRAALESQAWTDAAGVITSVTTSLRGIAPSPRDRDLLVSVPTAVQLVLDEHPSLRQTIESEFASLATLRVAQAVAAGDLDAVELASIQFAATSAAADAHRWLGDRALADGYFETALNHYRRAESINPAIQQALAPREALASAMLGRHPPSVPTGETQFGERSLSVEQFAALLAELRGRAKANSSIADAEPSVPPPARFTSHVRHRLELPGHERSKTSVSVNENVMFASDGVRIAAYDLDRAERLWQTGASAGATSDTQLRALIPMRPLVFGDHVFTRLLSSSASQLACLDRQSGRVVWTSELREGETLASDPLLVREKLAVLTVQSLPNDNRLLRYRTIDPHTGEMLFQSDLITLTESWSACHCCEFAECDDGLVAMLGGLALSVNSQGRVRWLRKHPVSTSEEDGASIMRLCQPPLVIQERLFVVQPNAGALDCLEAATGRRVWHVPIAELVGIVGRAGNLVVVRTETDIRGLNQADGETRWRFSADHLFDFYLVNDERLLVASREPAPRHSGSWQVRLTWLHPNDGQRTATTVVSDLSDTDPRLGALVPYKDRLFALFGRGTNAPTCDLIELVPAGDAEAVSTTWRAWSQ